MLRGGFLTAFSKYRRGIVLDFPVALMRRSMEGLLGQEWLQIPERILPV